RLMEAKADLAGQMKVWCDRHALTSDDHTKLSSARQGRPWPPSALLLARALWSCGLKHQNAICGLIALLIARNAPAVQSAIDQMPRNREFVPLDARRDDNLLPRHPLQFLQHGDDANRAVLADDPSRNSASDSHVNALVVQAGLENAAGHKHAILVSDLERQHRIALIRCLHPHGDLIFGHQLQG